MDDLIKTNGIRNKYTATGRNSGYQIDLYHKKLDEHKNLSAIEKKALQGKIHNQKITWETKWEKELLKQKQQSKDENARERTEKAKIKIQEVQHILKKTLDVDDTIDWSKIKHNDEFKLALNSKNLSDYISLNNKNGYPENVVFREEEEMPQKQYFFTKIGFFQKLVGLEEKIQKEQKKNFDDAAFETGVKNEKIQKENIMRKEELVKSQKDWEKQKSKFEQAQEQHNNKVENLRELYEKKDSNAIIEYCEMVLNNSQYIDSFPRIFDIQYNDVNGLLLLDYQLPSLKDIPSINNVRYVKSRDEIEEKYLSQVALAKLYDLSLYQISLRTLHELFEADKMILLT